MRASPPSAAAGAWACHSPLRVRSPNTLSQAIPDERSSRCLPGSYDWHSQTSDLKFQISDLRLARRSRRRQLPALDLHDALRVPLITLHAPIVQANHALASMRDARI